MVTCALSVSLEPLTAATVLKRHHSSQRAFGESGNAALRSSSAWMTALTGRVMRRSRPSRSSRTATRSWPRRSHKPLGRGDDRAGRERLAFA